MHAEITATPENIKACYKVRTEMRAALRSLLEVQHINHNGQKVNNAHILLNDYFSCSIVRL